MAIKIYRWGGASWTDMTADVPLRGYPELGITALSVQKTPSNWTGLARFGVEGDNAWLTDPGDEIKIEGSLSQPIFGGYVQRRTMFRKGDMFGANYDLADYNSLMDRTVVPDYTIDAGDTDSTEITTLVNTYLVPQGVSIGQIDTVQASLAEVHLQCTFRQAMEAICGQAAGAIFFIDHLKQFHYAQIPQDLTAPSWTGLDISDDPADFASAAIPYTTLAMIGDNTRRVDRVYIVGDGVEGWYGLPWGAYQAIVHDSTVTTSAALNALGAAITAWQNPQTTFTATVDSDKPFTAYGVRLKHSIFTSDAFDSQYVNRCDLSVASDDGTHVVCRIETGDRSRDGGFSGGGGQTTPGERGPIFGDGSTTTAIQPDDATDAGTERFAAREDHTHGFATGAPSDIGTSNAEGSASNMVRADHVHNHPSGLGANLHHNQVHVLATASALGPDHTVSGLTAGHVLRATGPTTAAFQAIVAGDLPNLGGTPAITWANSNGAGSAATYIRTDATIRLFNDSFTASTITPDASAATGSGGYASRRDHVHAIACAAPGTNLSVSTTNQEGSGSDFARALHVHAVDSSANPGNAASLLATDSNGQLRLQRLGIGGASTTSDNSIKFADDGWAGLRYDGPRVRFDETDDQIELVDADVQIATAGKGLRHVSGNTAGHVWVCDGTRAYPQALQYSDLPDLGGTPNLTFSTTNAEGSAASFIRTNATIALYHATNLPMPIEATTTASTGTDSNAARLDHEHEVYTAAPSANLTVSTTNTEGTGDYLARADHGHAITTSANPGAAAQILATDGSGNLTISGAFTMNSGAYMAGNLYHVGDTDTYINYTDDRIRLYAGGVLMMDAYESTSDSVTFPTQVAMAGICSHSGDGDTYFQWLDDRWNLYCGGTSMINVTEAATNTIGMGARVLMNGYGLYLDADDDSYFWTYADDSLGLYLGGTNYYKWTASKMTIGNILEIRTSGNVAGAEADIKADAQMGLAADRNIGLFIDDDGSETGETNFVAILHGDDDFTNATELFRFQENGRAGFGTASPNAILHLEQTDTGGNISCVRMDQDDTDQSYFSFHGTASDGVKTRSIVSEDDSGVSGMTTKGYVKIYIDDAGNRVTDGFYYMAFGTLN